MQDPTPHQTDIDSVIHQDSSATAPTNVAARENGHANGNGNGNGGKGRANGNGKAVVRAAENAVTKSVRPADAPGLTIERRFTQAGEDVYASVEWELRDAVISNERGEKVFEQVGVEIPKAWTQLATNVVVSKYFRGHIGTPEREHSVRQLIHRVADTMSDWGRAMDYFATPEDAQAFQDELTHILLHQKAAFNSPVWFNVGLPDQPAPQCSACFINSVDDTMASILTLAKTEGMLFKYGSGTGTNFSTIRGSKEKLNGGGTASGPISFMRGLDQFAGAIKCLTPDAYVYTGRGMQTLSEIIAPNLPSGFHADESVTLATKDGPARISHVYVSPEAETFRLRLRHTGLELRGTGEHPVLILTPDFELVWKRLADIQAGERVAVARRAEMWPNESPSFADFAAETKWVKKPLTYPASLTPELARLLGYMVSEGCMDDERFRFCNADEDVFNDFIHCVEATFGVDPVRNISRRVHPKTGVVTQVFEACWTNAVRFLKYVGLTTALSNEKTIPQSIRYAPRALVVEFLRAYFEGDGHISTHVYASSASKKLLIEVQLLLQNMGMIAALRPHPVQGKMYWNLYLRGEEAWIFNREIGFISERKRHAAQFAGDKNTNVDTVPFLAEALGTRVQGVRYLKCADGKNRDLNFGFFNRKPGAGISYALLRSAPGLVEKVRVVNPEWGATLETILAAEFFWDTALPVEAAELAVTYDFTVPGTHSFIANGIVNHNSGGKTRRAAKMAMLDVDHPDIMEFVTCKSKEEKKAWALIDAGYSGAFNVPGGAYDSILFQNANHSVRVSDDFMRAYEKNEDFSTKFVTTGKTAETHKARDIMQRIGESAWICGDPGMQYDTTINKWHTCKNTAPIYGSNPCCVTGDTLVAVADGRNAVAMRDLIGTEVPVFAHNHATGRTVVSRMWNIGVKRENAPIYRVTLDDGSSFRATDDHLIMQRDGSYRMVRELKAGDALMPFHSKVLAPAENRTRRRYYWAGRSWLPQYRAVWEAGNGTTPNGFHIHHADFNALNDTLENLQLLPAEEHNALHREKMLGENNPACRLMNDIWRENISAATSGAKNPNYGRTASEETRQKMREKSARRWASDEKREKSGAAIRVALAKAKAEGRSVGRPQGERFERSCPICRAAFETARIEQIFCGNDCRYSPMGRQMSGEKTAAKNRGQALSETHRAKLSVSVRAVSEPDMKRRAAQTGHRHTILKVARLLLDNGVAPTVASWNEVKAQAEAFGATRFPTAATVARHFADDAALREEAELFNHKVASVEFCGREDVFDGTVDEHHNFAILTSEEASCAPGAANYSGIFIHNSEYMFLNDSACNLASLNLMKFRYADGEFDVEAFKHASRIMLTAQEIIVDNASYPTPRIGENSRDYRPLGLGYANLGALLMARGLAYDSDEGRAYAGAITALMTGEAYHQSAIIARDHGWPFPGYEKNREPFLEVMQMHRDAVETINPEFVPDEMLNAARKSWDDAIFTGVKSGYRNAQASVLAPTGTIGFLLDCDTTGIEPDIAIVKYKSLVGGGVLKIVNNTVPEALTRLGYSPQQADAIIAYIDKNDTIEGAPELKPEHLSVFDCAFKPANGERSIHYMGHVKMMAAAQPFISGAISKTVNAPHEATANEIEQIYFEGWKIGLKAIAIYRDGSKRTQPLQTKKFEDDSKVEALPVAAAISAAPQTAAVKPLRRKLPDERHSITHKFSIAGHEGYITVGMYEDGAPGEIFLTMSKEGSTISGLMDSFATAISLALQYGVPIQTLVDKFAHARFEPAGYTNNPNIRIAKSITDYIFRWLGSKFLTSEPKTEPSLSNGHAEEANENTGGGLPAFSGKMPTLTLNGTPNEAAQISSLAAHEHETFQNQADAPVCTECGSLMVRNGACYKCLNCGSVFGCS